MAVSMATVVSIIAIVAVAVVSIPGVAAAIASVVAVSPVVVAVMAASVFTLDDDQAIVLLASPPVTTVPVSMPVLVPYPFGAVVPLGYRDGESRG